jgi:hypothetical protein
MTHSEDSYGYIIPSAIITNNKKLISNPITCQLQSRKLFWQIFFNSNRVRVPIQAINI